MRHPLAAFTLVAAGAYFLALGYVEWRYLRTGYNLAGQIMGPGPPEQPLIAHVSFPLWRPYLTCAITLLCSVGIALTLTLQSRGVVVVGSALSLTLIFGVWDVFRYGTLGSPTTLQRVGVAFVMFVMVLYLQRLRSTQ